MTFLHFLVSCVGYVGSMYNIFLYEKFRRFDDTGPRGSLCNTAVPRKIKQTKKKNRPSDRGHCLDPNKEVNFITQFSAANVRPDRALTSPPVVCHNVVENGFIVKISPSNDNGISDDAIWKSRFPQVF